MRLHRGARGPRAARCLALALAVGGLGLSSCGEEVAQVRFRAQFDEEVNSLLPPVCLGAAALQGFVYTTDPDVPLGGRISEVPAWLDIEDRCVIESGILVVKGVPFGRDRILRLQIVDSTLRTVLAYGDSVAENLSSGGASDEGVPTYDITLARTAAFDGTLHLNFPDGTDLSPLAGGALGVMIDGDQWSESREVPVPDSVPDGWESTVYLSGFELNENTGLKVFGRDNSGAQAALWLSVVNLTIDSNLQNQWAIAEFALHLEPG